MIYTGDSLNSSYTLLANTQIVLTALMMYLLFAGGVFSIASSTVMLIRVARSETFDWSVLFIWSALFSFGALVVVLILAK